jgi:hypothetical protein
MEIPVARHRSGDGDEVLHRTGATATIPDRRLVPLRIFTASDSPHMHWAEYGIVFDVKG